MEFNSFTFFAFLAAVLVLAALAPRKLRAWLLLGASYVFYGAWDPRFCLLILISTLIDFYLGQRIAASAGQQRRSFLIWSLVANLGILGVFKYCDFFIASFAPLVNADPNDYLLRLTLPVGISFFTFQTMSYSIDIYRGVIRPRTSLLDFALFVAFFPQLVAGPIVKAREFFPQHDRWRPAAPTEWNEGITLILVGLIKKTACADQLARFVDPYFANPTSGWLDAWTATIAFGGQIFFDFSGYSDIAIGVALLLGYRFPINFARPYLSTSITEFWRRWHISLSTWLRDYLYISLGGNRRGQVLTQRNLMLTMLLGGLWHGASWNFVVWGGLHGFYLMAHKLWVAKLRPQHLTTGLLRVPYALAAWLLTLAAVGVAWVFFRAREFSDSATVVRAMVLPDGLGTSVFGMGIWLALALFFALACAEERLQLVRRIVAGKAVWRGLAWALMLFALAIFARTDSHVTFIYFQF